MILVLDLIPRSSLVVLSILNFCLAPRFSILILPHLTTVGRRLSHYQFLEELGRDEMVIGMQTTDMPIGDIRTRTK